MPILHKNPTEQGQKIPGMGHKRNKLEICEWDIGCEMFEIKISELMLFISNDLD